MQRQETYERTYSQLLPEVKRPSTEDDHAIAVALAEDEREAQQRPLPQPDTSLDGQLALQLHEQESHKLLQPVRKRSRADRAFAKLLRSLNITRVIPRLNPGFVPDDSYVSQDRQRLLLRLDMYALQERPVIGDGNCQFRAIADQLHWDQNKHLQVREKVVEQLCSHADRYKDYVPTDYQQYVSSMSQSGTWGDHVTLQAAADAFGARLCVISSFLEHCVISIDPQQQQQPHSDDDKPSAPPLPVDQEHQQQPHQQQEELVQHSPNIRTIWLSFWAEVHYNSLAAKAPASPGDESDDSSSDSGSESGSKKLLGSKKLRKAADKLF